MSAPDFSGASSANWPAKERWSCGRKRLRLIRKILVANRGEIRHCSFVPPRTGHAPSQLSHEDRFALHRLRGQAYRVGKRGEPIRATLICRALSHWKETMRAFIRDTGSCPRSRDFQRREAGLVFVGPRTEYWRAGRQDREEIDQQAGVTVSPAARPRSRTMRSARIGRSLSVIVKARRRRRARGMSTTNEY